MLPGGDVQRVKSDGIRGHARLAVFQEDDRLGERLAALRIADVARQDDRPGLRQGREAEQRQGGRAEDASERNHLDYSALAADWPAR